MECALSTVPQRLDLNLYAGDARSIRFEFVDKVTGLPVEMEGTWVAQVRSTPTASTVVTSFSIDDSLQASGILTIGLSGAQIRSIPAGAVWDLERTLSGNQRTFMRGNVKVIQDVTRV